MFLHLPKKPRQRSEPCFTRTFRHRCLLLWSALSLPLSSFVQHVRAQPHDHTHSRHHTWLHTVSNQRSKNEKVKLFSETRNIPMCGYLRTPSGAAPLVFCDPWGFGMGTATSVSRVDCVAGLTCCFEARGDYGPFLTVETIENLWCSPLFSHAPWQHHCAWVRKNPFSSRHRRCIRSRECCRQSVDDDLLASYVQCHG